MTTDLMLISEKVSESVYTSMKPCSPGGARFSTPSPSRAVRFQMTPRARRFREEYFTPRSASIVRYGLRTEPRKLPRLELERLAFLRIAKRLTSDSTYKGRFVAILKGSLVDSDEDKIELIKRIYRKHGYVPVYIGKLPYERRALEMPSPEYYRK